MYVGCRRQQLYQQPYAIFKCRKNQRDVRSKVKSMKETKEKLIRNTYRLKAVNLFLMGYYFLFL